LREVDFKLIKKDTCELDSETLCTRSLWRFLTAEYSGTRLLPTAFSRRIRAIYLEYRLAAQSRKRVSAFRMVINGKGQAALFTSDEMAFAYNQRKDERVREEPNRTGTTTYWARVSLGKRDRSAPSFAIPLPTLFSRALHPSHCNRFYRSCRAVRQTIYLAKIDGKSVVERIFARMCHNDSINIQVSVGHLVSSGKVQLFRIRIYRVFKEDMI